MLTSQNLDQIKQYFYETRRELDRSLYWVHYENFLKKPYLTAAMDPGAAYAQTAAVGSPDARKALAGSNLWSVAGTNMTTALCTPAAGGGIKLTTAGANNDQCILQPLTVTTANSDICTIFGASGASGSTLNTSNQPQIHALVSLSSVAAVRLALSLKLTNAQDITTDNDEAQLIFNTSGAVNTSFFTWSTSIGGTDVETLGVDRYQNNYAPTAATLVVLSIVVDADRRPMFLINGEMVGWGSALTATTGLWPVLGLQALTGAAKAVTVRGLIIGSKF